MRPAPRSEAPRVRLGLPGDCRQRRCWRLQRPRQRHPHGNARPSFRSRQGTVAEPAWKLCAGRTLATVQGQNVSGHLFDKLSGQQPMGCGVQMPANGQMSGYLTAPEIQCLKDWFTRNPPIRLPDGGTPPAASASQPPPPGFSCTNPAVDAVANVLQRRCGSTCHSPNSPMFAASLDLSTAGVRARLVGTASKTCPNRTLIIPGRPEGYLFDKVQGLMPMGCGDRMPPVAPVLSAEEIKCLKDWIAPGVAQ
jgi:hypothetical protein